MAETTVATLLFTDLVASTELSQRLGEDGAEVLRHEHTSVLRDAISQTSGREVKHLGDGIMAVFGTPSEALSCAIAMQQAVDRHNRRLAEPLGLRVGLHIGEVTQEEGDYFGSAVVIAERLCKRADGQQIFLSNVLRALAGTRGGHAFKEIGPLELKGIDEPVSACELHWEPEREEGAPLPSIFRSVERLFFVGRADEVERLAHAWKLAANGDRQVALLSGEPGIGKTRLSTELAFAVHDMDGLVLYGRCDEDPIVPYQPFAEAFAHYVCHAPVETLQEHVAQHGGELARIVPELIARVPDAPRPIESASADPQADREAERFRLFEAAAALLRSATDDRPVLVVLDDLHWATRPTLLLLRRLLRDSESRHLMILGTYRDTDLARTHPLAEMLADWRRELDVERIALGGLDIEGALRFVQAAAGEQRDEELRVLAEALHRETEGNPFFMGQVLRHLVESGVVYQKDERWTYDVSVEQLGIPEGVRDVVGRRLSRLSDAANRALAVGAVIGGEFDVDVIERVTGEDMLDALDEAANARVVVEIPSSAGSYRFTHTLVRQTLYEELSSARRARLHQKVGEAIEAMHASDVEEVLPQLARHFGEGARAGTIEQAADYAVRAAQQAKIRAAYEEAIAQAERGLQVLDLDEGAHAVHRAELWLVIAESQSFLLDPGKSLEAAWQAGLVARSEGLADQTARAAQWFGVMSVFLRRADEAVELVDDALRMIGDEMPAQRSALISTKIWCLINLGRTADTVLMAEEALRLARDADDSWALGFAYFILAWQLRDVIGPVRALALAEEAVRELRDSGDAWAYGNALRARRIARLVLGDVKGFEEDGAEIGRIGEDLRSGLMSAVGLATSAVTAMFAGRLGEARECVNEYMRRWGSTLLAFTYAIRVMGLNYERGALDKARETAQQLADTRVFTGTFDAALAAFEAAQGDVGRVRRRLDVLGANDFAVVDAAAWKLTTVALLAEACAEAGDGDAASCLMRLVDPSVPQLVAMGDGYLALGALDRYVGILATTAGDVDEGVRRLEAALEFEERLDAPALAIRTKYWLARALLKRREDGDAERASTLLDECFERARSFEMADLAAKADALRTNV